MKLKFEWDEAKARSNLRKHGVVFEDAQRVFGDAFAVEFLDTRIDYGEERFVIVGIVNAMLLSVVYTERGEHIRMVSARRATRYEQEEYYRSQSPD